MSVAFIFPQSITSLKSSSIKKDVNNDSKFTGNGFSSHQSYTMEEVEVGTLLTEGTLVNLSTFI